MALRMCFSERFRLENSLTKRTVRQWNKVPRKVVESPSQEVFNRLVDREFEDRIWTWLSVQLDFIVFGVLSNGNSSVMILVLMFLFLKTMLYIQRK